jgi:transposase InsO family protein
MQGCGVSPLSHADECVRLAGLTDDLIVQGQLLDLAQEWMLAAQRARRPSVREAQIVIESWRRHYNTIRPHASLGYKPPAPEVFVPAFAAWPAALRQPAPPATLAQRPTLN